MPITVENQGVILDPNNPRLRGADSIPLVPKTASGSLNSVGNTPSVSEMAAKEGHSPRSPALQSLMNMVNFQADSASLELYLADIIESNRDTENRIGKSRIDLLTNSKLAQLKEKQDKIAEAQRKFDEAEKLQSASKVFSWIRFGISVFTAAASIALICTGVGAGVGICMLGLLAVSLTSTVNEGINLATGKGIAGHVATLAGASKKTAAYWDLGASIALFSLGALLAIGPLIAACLTGATVATAAGSAASSLTAGTGILTGIIGFTQAVLSYSTSSASADGLNLSSLAKKYEAAIQQLDSYVQHATDSMIASNNRNNQTIENLIQSYSDVSDAMSLVIFVN